MGANARARLSDETVLGSQSNEKFLQASEKMRKIAPIFKGDSLLLSADIHHSEDLGEVTDMTSGFVSK